MIREIRPQAVEHYNICEQKTSLHRSEELKYLGINEILAFEKSCELKLAFNTLYDLKHHIIMHLLTPKGFNCG